MIQTALKKFLNVAEKPFVILIFIPISSKYSKRAGIFIVVPSFKSLFAPNFKFIEVKFVIGALECFTVILKIKEVNN